VGKGRPTKEGMKNGGTKKRKEKMNLS